MMPDSSTLSLAAAFVAGLAASGHCIAMCGGIAGALAMRGRQGSTAARLGTALAYNLSRILSYSLAGAIVGLLGRTLLAAVNVAPLSVAFRVLAGAIMLALAGKLMFGWRLLDPFIDQIPNHQLSRVKQLQHHPSLIWRDGERFKSGIDCSEFFGK